MYCILVHHQRYRKRHLRPEQGLSERLATRHPGMEQSSVHIQIYKKRTLDNPYPPPYIYILISNYHAQIELFSLKILYVLCFSLMTCGVFYPNCVLFYIVKLDRDLPYRTPIIYLFFSIFTLKDIFANGARSLEKRQICLEHLTDIFHLFIMDPLIIFYFIVVHRDSVIDQFC